MTAKLWGGILVGVFVVAAVAEIARRKCPGLSKKVSEHAKSMVGSSGQKVKDFTISAQTAFKKGYASVKA